jgi:hypothetical protein
MSTAAIDGEAKIETVGEAQNSFESARQAAGTAKTEAVKAQRLVEYLDDVRRKHQGEKPSIADILPDNPRVVAWRSDGDEIQTLYRNAVADRNQKTADQLQAEKTEKAAKLRLAQHRLAAVHSELEELNPRLAKMAADLEHSQSARNVIRTQLMNIAATLRDGKPALFEHLTHDDPVRRRWELESKPLFDKRVELQGKIDSLAGPDPLEVAKLRDRVAHLETFVIPNLEREITGGDAIYVA